MHLIFLRRQGITDCRPIDSAFPRSGEPLSDPGRYRRLVRKLNNLTVIRPDITVDVSVVFSKQKIKLVTNKYPDDNVSGLSSAALEIKDTGNGSASVGLLLLVFASKPPNLGNWLKLNYILAEVFPRQSKVASWKGVFSGNLSLDVMEGSKWNMTRSGFCGMRSKKIYTENWVNSPGQDEDNSWQAFVSVPRDNWYITKVSSSFLSSSMDVKTHITEGSQKYLFNLREENDKEVAFIGCVDPSYSLCTYMEREHNKRKDVDESSSNRWHVSICQCRSKQNWNTLKKDHKRRGRVERPYQLVKIVEILATGLVFLKSSIGDLEDTGSFSKYLGGKKEIIELMKGVKPYYSLGLNAASLPTMYTIKVKLSDFSLVINEALQFY
ncbi:hypothetical protein T459_12190 [Capsicum annuum]|uniref:Uncharacterized protein n=1 Tax=Capsicum annuum TaxID=4072 RepID=A0A2G2ZP40_CAPAN|nr:putative complex I intermediate-associated protein 30-like isoform 2 [Capsicum annuum]PHT83747.1 hypothetical protein T459_12190 [Capsicum annuum]